MGRRLIKFASPLILGTIVNVVVAWGFVSPLFWKPWFGEGAQAESGFFHFEGWEWHYDTTVYTGVRTTLVRPLRMRFMVKPEDCRPPVFIVVPLWIADKKIDVFQRIEVGWPCKSLQYALGYRGDIDKVYGLVMRGAWQFQNHPEPGSVLTKGQFAALPWMTAWPGFAINTVFYAAVLWMLFAVPGAVRRFVRRRRGRCTRCGYDLRGQPQPPESGHKTCPECGQIA
jgi:hypothetical protein